MKGYGRSTQSSIPWLMNFPKYETQLIDSSLRINQPQVLSGQYTPTITLTHGGRSEETLSVMASRLKHCGSTVKRSKVMYDCYKLDRRLICKYLHLQQYECRLRPETHPILLGTSDIVLEHILKTPLMVLERQTSFPL